MSSLIGEAVGGTAFRGVVEIDHPLMAYRALYQLRENVKALLAARREDQKTLAFAMRKHPTTLNKFLTGKRELQLADLDAVADFFGIATYQLFQPGIARLTERRTGHDRRSGTDRRVGNTLRQMQGVAAEIEAARPGARHDRALSAAAARDLRTLVADFETKAAALSALLGAAPRGGSVPTPRRRRSAVSRPTGTTGPTPPRKD